MKKSYLNAIKSVMEGEKLVEAFSIQYKVNGKWQHHKCVKDLAEGEEFLACLSESVAPLYRISDTTKSRYISEAVPTEPKQVAKDTGKDPEDQIAEPKQTDAADKGGDVEAEKKAGSVPGQKLTMKEGEDEDDKDESDEEDDESDEKDDESDEKKEVKESDEKDDESDEKDDESDKKDEEDPEKKEVKEADESDEKDDDEAEKKEDDEDDDSKCEGFKDGDPYAIKYRDQSGKIKRESFKSNEAMTKWIEKNEEKIDEILSYSNPSESADDRAAIIQELKALGIEEAVCESIVQAFTDTLESRVKSIEEALESKYAEIMEAEVAETKSKLLEQVQTMVSERVTSIKESLEAEVESLRQESVSESKEEITALQEQVEAAKGLTEQVETLQEALNSSSDRINELKNALLVSIKSRDLSENQIEKLGESIESQIKIMPHDEFTKLVESEIEKINAPLNKKVNEEKAEDVFGTTLVKKDPLVESVIKAIGRVTVR